MRRQRTAACLVGALCVMTGGLGAVSQAAAPEVELDGDRVVVSLAGGRAVVDPATLEVKARTADGREWQLSAPAAEPLGPAGEVRVEDGRASWRYPGMTVTAAEQAGRLSIAVHADRDTAMTWPVTGTDPGVSEMQFPRGEGLSVPVADPWWNSGQARLAGSEAEMVGGLTMPFWGHSGAGRGVSYIAENDIGTSLRFVSQRGRLHAETVHDFSAREGTLDHAVTFALTDGSPVAPARDYRRWLDEHGGRETLRRKIAENPEVGKLVGAFHAYTWGQARTPEGVRRLRELGIDRMWLGYDADGRPMSPEAVKAAKDAGYLVGPYDSWANAQDPAQADNPSSRWPAPVWQEACVREADGEVMPGFRDRGCYLSSEAFARNPRLMADRTGEMTANGANSYFLDVDAAGELHTDHSPAHPMNKERDRRNRLDRMGRLAGDLVLGSESAGAWSAPVLSYNHGSSTPVSDHLWELEKDKDFWGGYAPEGAPEAFFEPVELPADAAKAMFAPQYRVPLYQTVLHDSVIGTDRWELPWSKLPRQATDRVAMAMLHNTPLNLVLNETELDAHGAEIAALQRYFAPLHQAAATEPMTGFRWLTADHLVQRTTFGDGALTVTANFSGRAHDGLPAGCVDATVKGDTAPRRLCPGPL
ncbi:lipoprotein, putative [Saccharopolyspora erythraea NRRL 2338]|uniref:Lipoprotein, putative n=2 Tax=Saccharopolyspora erythraea TaxID=1836 RepID=A4FKE9_SACEN|nr:glycoside hydrolase [Saccharopolyspora erythraea]QRK88265.1 glycoside hydrolase [Saccharopolyspora erythraea]CAM04524.1 lipoprotein, putative [Saccharopolyspora erythraea NRRL 2338]